MCAPSFELLLVWADCLEPSAGLSVCGREEQGEGVEGFGYELFWEEAGVEAGRGMVELTDSGRATRGVCGLPVLELQEACALKDKDSSVIVHQAEVVGYVGGPFNLDAADLMEVPSCEYSSELISPVLDLWGEMAGNNRR